MNTEIAIRAFKLLDKILRTMDFEIKLRFLKVRRLCSFKTNFKKNPEKKLKDYHDPTLVLQSFKLKTIALLLFKQGIAYLAF